MTARFVSVLAAVCVGFSISAAHALTITPTTDGGALASALGGSGLTINSVTASNGSPAQFGTYTGFTSPPVTIGDGVVLSSGEVAQVLPAFNNGLQGPGSTPSTNTSASGTPEFDAYGAGNITNFSESNNVARLQVDFTLAAPGHVQFSFIFGSIEFPEFTSNFTDAFLVFLDGTDPGDQITFDNANNPVQVGSSFANLLTTADTNTAFADPHGLITNLTTVSPLLAAGSHTLLFEVGDVNDTIIDSAAFIADFGLCTAAECIPGTTPPTVPEPGTVTLLGVALVALGAMRRRRTRPVTA